MGDDLGVMDRGEYRRPEEHRHQQEEDPTQMGDQGGRPTYVIRWQMAKDGRVVEFVVDAESGQLLSGPAG